MKATLDFLLASGEYIIGIQALNTFVSGGFRLPVPSCRMTENILSSSGSLLGLTNMNAYSTFFGIITLNTIRYPRKWREPCLVGPHLVIMYRMSWKWTFIREWMLSSSICIYLLCRNWILPAPILGDFKNIRTSIIMLKIFQNSNEMNKPFYFAFSFDLF